jgi:hypothetical protein
MAEPELLIRLTTDAEGRPLVVSGNTPFTHYGVEFEVENPPEDTYAATFELDSTNVNPVRTLPPDSNGKFRLVTSTSGDYPVVVRLRTKHGREVTLKESVAKALRKGAVGFTVTPAYLDALNDIADH